jgi:hypothetical protein
MPALYRGSSGTSISWRRAAIALAALSFIQLAYIVSSDGSGIESAQPFPIAARSVVRRQNINANTMLSSDQCQQEYPDLYHEVNRASSFWRDRDHEIGPEDVDISWRFSGALKVLIMDNELRILETRNTFRDDAYRPRTLATLSQIQAALWAATARGERLPNVEAAIVLDDISFIPQKTNHTVWTLASRVNDEAHDRHWLIPDFNLHSSTAPSGAYGDIQRRAASEDAPITDKRQQAVWRGVTWSNEPVRNALLAATNNQSWADTAIVDVDTSDDELSVEELCRYAAILHTEGRSYSSRLTFLLNCGSLPVVHDLGWRTHYTHLLTANGPRQNYVPVRRDWTDLSDTVQWYLARPHEAQRVADESVRTFRERYLAPTATSCYWRRLISAYGENSFEPDVYEPTYPGSSEMRMRGVPFEEFIHMKADYKP